MFNFFKKKYTLEKPRDVQIGNLEEHRETVENEMRKSIEKYKK